MSQVGSTRDIYTLQCYWVFPYLFPHMFYSITQLILPQVFLFSLGNPWDYRPSDSQPPHILYSNNFHKAFSLFVLKVDD